MCEYCKGVGSGRPCKPFHDKFASAELQWCAGHELPTLFVYLHGDCTGIEVERCPKCGRKLNDLREMRQCRKCGAIKPVSEFYRDRDRHRWHCKECVKERIKENKEKNTIG